MGSSVTLRVKKGDGTIGEVAIERGGVVLASRGTPSAVLQLKGQEEEAPRIGFISLPDFDDSTVDNFFKEFELLQKGSIKGVILDLRDNMGGGGFKSARAIAGFFLGQGPFAQFLDREREVFLIETMERESSGNYEGPLLVMVSGNTAGLAEVLASAVQEYQRGIILGGRQTSGFGVFYDTFLEL